MYLTLLLQVEDAGYTLGYLIGSFFTIVLLGGIYFIPAILGRKKRQHMSIFLLNLFLGWTFLGWIGALIWALSKDDSPVVVRPAAALSVADELSKLQALRDTGALSEEEFQQQRQRLLTRPA